MLSDASCWKNLRSAEALKGPTQIPLPQSNSPVAKAMRIASVLSILSRTLHKHIFRPFYLMDDDAELTRLLHGVEFESPAREEHIRSTLLATLPDIQRHGAKTRVQHVVREVSWVVQHLLGALPYDAFCSGLGSACALACTEWQKIQMARMKIEPYFGPPYDEFDWQALPLPEFEGRKGSPLARSGVSTPVIITVDDTAAVELDGTAVVAETETTTTEAATNGDAPAGEGEDALKTEGAAAEVESEPVEGNTDATTDADNETAIVDDDDDDNYENGDEATVTVESDVDDDDEDDMDPADILLVVWPSMAVAENGEHQPITQGLVVTKAQAALAFQEVYAARQAAAGGGNGLNSKRARTMSIPSTMPKPTLGSSRDVLSAGNSPRPGKAFLAVSGGGEEAVSAAG